ncbi:patatin-like phospholipase family protein [Tomitella biformata]|uniref:patatin-like phospholipase family protein n=1 Tax=Tomitella biformata TaxID=630403 RepID=UPI00046402E2|nr:patatin-like phospholipase family protein [Tomitella biformata]
MALGLVLGGGGVAGIAWEVGILAGLAEAGVELGRPSRVIGTSAGSIVGAQVAAGAEVAAMLDAQLAALPPGEGAERPEHDLDVWSELLFERGPESHDDGLRALMRRIGAMAAEAQTASLEVYRAVIDGQLPVQDWPAGADLQLTSVAAATGELTVWAADSGASLLEAVMASCAVPGLMPLVPIAGKRYFDGGLNSSTHADLAAGCSEVLVIAPFSEAVAGPTLAAELDALQDSRTAAIVPDANSRQAFGTNPLAPSTRLPAALAGRAQGRAEAMRIGILLSL